jgi:hypothetical protein
MYQLFNHGDATPSAGLRVGIGVRDRLSIIGGWHNSKQGLELHYEEVHDEYDEYDEYGSEYLLTTGLSLNQYQAGLKSEMRITDWLYPYFTGQALLVHGTVRLDDDTSTRSNPGQVRRDSLGVGVMGTIGIDIRIPQKMFPFTLGWHIDGGYAWVSPMNYKDLGQLTPGGTVLRSGLGIRF